MNNYNVYNLNESEEQNRYRTEIVSDEDSETDDFKSNYPVIINNRHTQSSDVLNTIGVIGYNEKNQIESNVITEKNVALEHGTVLYNGGYIRQVSKEDLEEHEARKQLLLSVLDTCTKSRCTEHKEILAIDNFEFKSPQIHASKVEIKVPMKSVIQSHKISSEVVIADPFYDEKMDQEDEQWIDENYRGRAQTDAILNCPCCFLTISMNCKRDLKLVTQYTTTSAINCRIQRDSILEYNCNPENIPHGSPRSSRNIENTHEELKENEFYPVTCSSCGTQVGIYAKDHIYHFLHALPSNG